MNFFLSSLTKAINAYLKLDPESQQRFGKLQQKAISIQLLPFNFHFQLAFTTDNVQVYADDVHTAAATIRGTPLQLASVMLATDRHRFFADDVSIEGNAEVAQQVINLFDNLHIDWEEYASHFIGDIPAYHAGRAVKKIRNFLNQVDDSLSRNVGEYIQEERRWMPSREALKDFFTDIDTLRMDVDRIEAKISHLTNLINDDEGSQ